MLLAVGVLRFVGFFGRGVCATVCGRAGGVSCYGQYMERRRLYSVVYRIRFSLNGFARHSLSWIRTRDSVAVYIWVVQKHLDLDWSRELPT